jgi:hypothetical protein
MLPRFSPERGLQAAVDSSNGRAALLRSPDCQGGAAAPLATNSSPRKLTSIGLPTSVWRICENE